MSLNSNELFNTTLMNNNQFLLFSPRADFIFGVPQDLNIKTGYCSKRYLSRDGSACSAGGHGIFSVAGFKAVATIFRLYIRDQLP